MPKRKKSRVPTRPKPVLPDDSMVEANMDSEQRQEKTKLLLADFDREVERRKQLMEEEIKNIEQIIQQIYKIDLMRNKSTLNSMLWVDMVKEQKDDESTARRSLANIINTADTVLQSAAKKRGRPAKLQPNMDMVPATATRSTRANRQKAVLGNSQSENMPPPPTTARTQRTKKVKDELTTPCNRMVPPSFLNTMYVTPKFDPRTPLAPGTKRKPRLGEIAISLTGSPLQVSPAFNSNYNIKGLMESLNQDDMDEDTKTELLAFHAKVGKLLNM